MEIVLKSIKVVKSMSEETICFTAVMYVNGSKTADVSNRGCGGSHDYFIHNEELFEQAESYTASLPPTVGPFGPLNMDLELFISMYVGEYLEKKELESEHKKMLKLCANSICYGKADFDGNYKIITFRKSTIAEIKANPISSKKLDVLIAETKSKLEKGHIIYNTNV